MMIFVTICKKPVIVIVFGKKIKSLRWEYYILFYSFLEILLKVYIIIFNLKN